MGTADHLGIRLLKQLKMRAVSTKLVGGKLYTATLSSEQELECSLTGLLNVAAGVNRKQADVSRMYYNRTILIRG